MEWKKSTESLQKSKGSKNFQVGTAFKIKCSEVRTMMTAGEEVKKSTTSPQGRSQRRPFLELESSHPPGQWPTCCLVTLLVLGSTGLFTAALFFCFPCAYAIFPTRSEMDNGLDCVFTPGSVAMHDTLPPDSWDCKTENTKFSEPDSGRSSEKWIFVLVLNVRNCLRDTV